MWPQRNTIRKTTVIILMILQKVLSDISINEVTMLSEWQKQKLSDVESDLGVNCLLNMWLKVQSKMVEGTYCNATWDGHYCWPPANAGTTLIRNCTDTFRETEPIYASHLEGIAFRTCQKNGSWMNGDWTNYSQCVDSYEKFVEKTTEENELKDQIRYIVFIGSILSLVFLLTAIFVFCCFKSIWCDRVTIHIHLMAALTFRYILLYIITEPFVFKRESSYREEDWVCKSVVALYLYATVISVNWMFIQGIYLNGKLTNNVFDKAAPLKFYYIIGWLIPAPLLGVYAYVMEKNHPVKCWKGYSDMKEIWIILGPIVVALLINLGLLINILRILVTKVHRGSSSSEAAQFQHFKRAAKATIILSPILGINNLLFIYNPGGSYNRIYSILNTFFGSTQGVFVALVYCHLSSDVCSAIRRTYKRFLARRNASRSRVQQSRSTSSSTYTSVMLVEQPVNRYRKKNLSKSNGQLSLCSINVSTLSAQSINISTSRVLQTQQNSHTGSNFLASSKKYNFHLQNRSTSVEQCHQCRNPFLTRSQSSIQS